MALSSLQVEVLHQIGIPIWERRSVMVDKVTKPQSPADAIDLSATNWICIPKLNLSPSEQRLLAAILKAVNLESQSVAMLELTQLESVLEQSSAQHKIMVFDMAAAGQFFEHQPLDVPTPVRLASSALLSVTHSLTALNDNPYLKKHAWLALKRLYLA